jgi:acyl carrier protein
MKNGKTEKVKEIFRVVFELPPAADVTHIEQKTQSNWDSLGHVTLIAALESEFSIRLDIADTLRINSFETTLQFLEEKGVEDLPHQG